MIFFLFLLQVSHNLCYCITTKYPLDCSVYLIRKWIFILFFTFSSALYVRIARYDGSRLSIDRSDWMSAGVDTCTVLRFTILYKNMRVIIAMMEARSIFLWSSERKSWEV